MREVWNRGGGMKVVKTLLSTPCPKGIKNGQIGINEKIIDLIEKTTNGV